jgi:hypothetical protein
MQDQHTVPPPDVDRTQPEFDRRRGPRRADAADVPFDRRQGDRRKNKPGLAGLFSAIFRGAAKDDETEA